MNKEEYMKIQESRSADNNDRNISNWCTKFFEEYSKYIKEPVLEIGCSNGPVLEYLNKKGIFTIGLDISRKAVWNCINHKYPVPAVWYDTQKILPFPDKSFKTVLMFHTLEHCINVKKVLGNINRVLDGNLCTITPIKASPSINYGHFASFNNIDDFKSYFKDYRILEFDSVNYIGTLLIATNKEYEAIYCNSNS